MFYKSETKNPTKISHYVTDHTQKYRKYYLPYVQLQ